MEVLDEAFTKAEIFSNKNEYSGALTQIVLRQLKLPLQFFFGDGVTEVLTFGWPIDIGEAPAWAMRTLRRMQSIVALVKTLVNEQQSSGLQPLFRRFDLELWRRSRSSDRAVLKSLLAEFSEQLHLPCCEAEFTVVLHHALADYKTALQKQDMKIE